MSKKIKPIKTYKRYYLLKNKRIETYRRYYLFKNNLIKLSIKNRSKLFFKKHFYKVQVWQKLAPRLKHFFSFVHSVCVWLVIGSLKQYLLVLDQTSPVLLFKNPILSLAPIFFQNNDLLYKKKTNFFFIYINFVIKHFFDKNLYSFLACAQTNVEIFFLKLLAS